MTTLLDTILARDPFFADLDRMTRHLLADRQPDGSGVVTMMPMDVLRRGDEVILRLDVPGVESDDVDVTVNGRVLTVEAVRRSDDADGDTYFARGLSYGRIRRQLTLPDGLALDRITATCDNGVLTLRVPLTEAAKPRRIEIGKAREHASPELTS